MHGLIEGANRSGERAAGEVYRELSLNLPVPSSGSPT
jgi:hypothetical protein